MRNKVTHSEAPEGSSWSWPVYLWRHYRCCMTILSIIPSLSSQSDSAPLVWPDVPGDKRAAWSGHNHHYIVTAWLVSPLLRISFWPLILTPPLLTLAAVGGGKMSRYSLTTWISPQLTTSLIKLGQELETFINTKYTIISRSRKESNVMS